MINNKFRAMRECDCKFVYGSLVTLADGEVCILQPSDIVRDGHRVMINADDIPTWFCKGTVGQFTGSYDKNGKEIYDGDLVKDFAGEVFRVQWDAEACSFKIQNSKHSFLTSMIALGIFEVIGNVYENPDLFLHEIFTEESAEEDSSMDSFWDEEDSSMDSFWETGSAVMQFNFRAMEECSAECYNSCIQKIRGQLLFVPENQWIPLSERFPSDCEEILFLTTCTSTGVTVAFFGYYGEVSGEFITDKSTATYSMPEDYTQAEHLEVVAWLPLARLYSATK